MPEAPVKPVPSGKKAGPAGEIPLSGVFILLVVIAGLILLSILFAFGNWNPEFFR